MVSALESRLRAGTDLSSAILSTEVVHRPLRHLNIAVCGVVHGILLLLTFYFLESIRRHVRAQFL